MQQQGVPNGLPPYHQPQQPPQPPQQQQFKHRPFNGVSSSSHSSSRDSSPSAHPNHIPPSQLAHNFQRLQVGTPSTFGASTPLRQPQAFTQSNVCSPVEALPSSQGYQNVGNLNRQPVQNVQNYQNVGNVDRQSIPNYNYSATPQVPQYSGMGYSQGNANPGQYYAQSNAGQALSPPLPNLGVPPPTAYQQNQQIYKTNRYPYQGHNGQEYQNLSVPKHGFNKLWGTESYDLLQIPNILPQTKIEPPKVHLGQECLDQANCSPEIFRCTLTKIPETSSLLQKSRLPLGILIHPFKDLNHLPVIQCNVIVRCRACRTYINPFVYFVDGKRWKCNLCYRVNELPEEFQYDPVSKTYGDPSRRPEIKSSTIEYIAPAEYMLRPPQPAVYLFLLDISRLAIESGYLQTFCDILTSEISNLPGDSRTQIGFLAFDSMLHFFALNDGLSRPHEMIVVEMDEVFLPCPENLLVNLKDKKELVLDLLSQLPTKYIESFDNGSALGAALQAAHKLVGSLGGRVTVFQVRLI